MAGLPRRDVAGLPRSDVAACVVVDGDGGWGGGIALEFVSVTWHHFALMYARKTEDEVMEAHSKLRIANPD